MIVINKVHVNKSQVNLIKAILIVKKFKWFILTLELVKHMRKCLTHSAFEFLFLLILIYIITLKMSII